MTVLNSRKSPQFLKTCLLSAMVAAGLCLGGTPALADDQDPFHVEADHWMSLDFYKEDLKEHPAASKQETPATQATIQPPDLPQPVAAAKEVPLPPVSEPATLAVAAPSRPLDLPVMPGMNKGYQVTVASTAEDISQDDAPQKVSLPSLADDKKPDLVLPTTHWQSAVDFAHKKVSADTDDEEDHQQLDIRMSFLPNANIQPAPDPEHVRNHGRPANSAALLAQSTPVAKKSAADIAACAAIDAYKKKQLEAIQSDRETLAALRSAVTQLGLQKQLGFITGASNNVANAETSTLAPKLDTVQTSKP